MNVELKNRIQTQRVTARRCDSGGQGEGEEGPPVGACT